MTEFLSTGTAGRIAYERAGEGHPVILIGGAMQFRAVDEPTRALTDELSRRGLTAVNYDRPGRGQSTGAGAFGLDAEIEAVRALVEQVGGAGALYGSSSGAAIALAAATSVPGITDLVLWEPPLGPESGTDGAEFLERLRSAVGTDDAERIVATFMEGMPPQWYDGIRNGPDWPAYAQMAPTLVGDAEALAWTQSSPRDRLWASIDVPTTVLLGREAFDFFREAASSIATSLTDAEVVELPGSEHSWEAADLAAAIATCLKAESA
ncbi:alpha/beta fold hydrolase [Kribbella sp. CA-293567]|uniref:alpha/beta fold hydrolase n=1 Tax=Kribbella sp. CA-293567 TaxID=3002436 RepID=UPI0022DDD457|nr:alpha/beta fold hydrolase [Kribbella sp. CA-293567]WBQ08366.1 alpha/beta fold hydrolase [Kribbella sp. CA-293567]